MNLNGPGPQQRSLMKWPLTLPAHGILATTFLESRKALVRRMLSKATEHKPPCYRHLPGCQQREKQKCLLFLPVWTWITVTELSRLQTRLVAKFFLTSNLYLPISGELAFRLFNNHSVRLTWNACLLTLEGCQVKSVDDWPVLRKDRLCCSVWPKARHHQGAFRNAEFQSPPLT